MDENRRLEIAAKVAGYLTETYGRDLPLLLRTDQHKPLLIEAVESLGLEDEVKQDYYGLMSRVNPKLCALQFPER